MTSDGLFGIVFTDWRLTIPALLTMLAALGGTAFSLINMRHPGRWLVPFSGCSAGLYRHSGLGKGDVAPRSG